MKVLWLKTALRNRFEQLDYIASENPAAAVRLDEEIERQADLLAEHPFLGRDGRIAGTRELVIARSPFVLVYRVRKRKIEILRLLHGAQLFPK